MVIGIIVVLVATVVQVLEVDALEPLSGDGFYHVIAMAGVPFLYRGGQRLLRS